MEPVSVVHKDSFFDTIWARVIAALVAIGGIALFIAANPGTLFGSNTDIAGAGNAGYQQCLDERMAAVETLATEAGFTVKRKELAELRALETCREMSAAE